MKNKDSSTLWRLIQCYLKRVHAFARRRRTAKLADDKETRRALLIFMALCGWYLGSLGVRRTGAKLDLLPEIKALKIPQQRAHAQWALNGLLVAKKLLRNATKKQGGGNGDEEEEVNRQLAALEASMPDEDEGSNAPSEKEEEELDRQLAALEASIPDEDEGEDGAAVAAANAELARGTWTQEEEDDLLRELEQL